MTRLAGLTYVTLAYFATKMTIVCVSSKKAADVALKFN